jgi:hypothetical protein
VNIEAQLVTCFFSKYTSTAPKGIRRLFGLEHNTFCHRAWNLGIVVGSYLLGSSGQPKGFIFQLPFHKEWKSRKCEENAYPFCGVLHPCV